MFIENRIRKETKQIVVYWEKLVIENYKGFSVQVMGKNNFVFLVGILRRTTTVNYKNQKVFLIHNPKTIICEAQAIKKLENSKVSERIRGEEAKAVQAKKSVRWMPWHWEPKKDAITCDKPRWGGNNLWPADFRMGKPLWRRAIDP